MLNWVEHEKSFITSGPDCLQSCSFNDTAALQKKGW